MAVKLYVGNLDYSVTDDQLAKVFAKAGTVVSVVIISDRYSGRSKGFGFVEYGTKEEADKAIEMFNGKKPEGLEGDRELVVNPARPRQPRDNNFRRDQRNY